MPLCIYPDFRLLLSGIPDNMCGIPDGLVRLAKKQKTMNPEIFRKFSRRLLESIFYPRGLAYHATALGMGKGEPGSQSMNAEVLLKWDNNMVESGSKRQWTSSLGQIFSAIHPVASNRNSNIAN